MVLSPFGWRNSFAMGSVLNLCSVPDPAYLAHQHATRKHQLDQRDPVRIFKMTIFYRSARTGIAFFLSADIRGMAVSGEGAEIVPAWGVCHFVVLYFYEDKMVKTYIFTGKKNALLNDGVDGSVKFVAQFHKEPADITKRVDQGHVVTNSHRIVSEHFFSSL